MIKSTIEEVKLPVDKVDIIISEWMGYFLLYEGMLDSVIFARDKWLKEGGLILPDKALINIAAIEDTSLRPTKIDFWMDVHGIDMSCIRDVAICEPLIESCDKSLVASTVSRIFDVDLYTITKQQLDFSNPYELRILRNVNINAIVAWFDVFFEKLPIKTGFSTSPFVNQTHWKQTIFYIKQEVQTKKGRQNF